jgi:hypothetical protein
VKHYLLAGFLRCAKCGHTLKGRNRHGVKRTYYHETGKTCGLHTVPGEALEAQILDHLYRLFLDKPAFDRAVQTAAPSDKDRKAIANERSVLLKQIATNETGIKRLADAVEQGMDLSLLLDRQVALKAERDGLAERLEELNDRLATLPDPEMTKRAAMVTRLCLMQQYQGRDWRKLSYDDVRRFLFHLFGESTMASGTGIFASRDDKGTLIITFKGLVEFPALLRNGRPFTRELLDAVDRWNRYCEEYRQKPQKPRENGENSTSGDGPLSANKYGGRILEPSRSASQAGRRSHTRGCFAFTGPTPVVISRSRS